MQRRNTEGRGADNSWSMNGGFPPFPDPFAGFGFGGQSSFLSNVFENDPFFSDPFFTRPFGNPFGSRSIFGPGGLFGTDGFSGRGLFQQPHPSQGQGGILDQTPYDSSAGQRNRRNVHIEDAPSGVHIEELPEDHAMVGNGHHNSNEEPIIEHPDDDDDETDSFRGGPDDYSNQQRTTLLHTSRNQSGSGSGPSRSTNDRSGRSYSFQRSSVVYGGPNGPYYSSQTTRRQGQGGVIEEEHQEKDTTSGTESHRISRGLGDKGRSLTRKRNAEGREEKVEILHNLEEDDVQNFDRAWETGARESLPRWNKRDSERLGSSSIVRSALPSSGGSQSKGH